MAKISIPVIIHGVTGRMGQIAVRALQTIAREKMAIVDGDEILPVAIGLGRSSAKVRDIAEKMGLEHTSTDLEHAVESARRINPGNIVYHNTLATGIRRDILLDVLPRFDPALISVYMEKPIASNYSDGWAMVDALEQGGFLDGVVHHMLSTPGVKRALSLMPDIKPLSAQMAFGYEVGSGLNGKAQFSGQRPDFNWLLAQAGGGIILDMCHEGYLSEALFGETERLSAVARLLIPKRKSTDGGTILNCDVEDFAALRREHVSGVVNTSIWSWYRRVNSEFGPLEITVEGENGSLVFGLYGLKVQWRETAPANRWERSVSGEKIEWRDYWQVIDLSYRDPFAIELAEFLCCVVKREKYPRNAVHALNLLGQVEAFYDSAAQSGSVIERDQILTYPTAVPASWKPERLEGKLRVVK